MKKQSGTYQIYTDEKPIFVTHPILVKKAVAMVERSIAFGERTYFDSANVINTTAIAEGLADECGRTDWLDDDGSVVWDVAVDAAEHLRDIYAWINE